MGKPGPRPRITDEDVLEVFHEQERSRTPLTASEVATELGCARSTAFEKLSGLADDGRLETKKVGARGRVWWLPADTDSGTAIDAGDPLFTGGALFASGDSVEEEDIDEVLYGEG